jgi:hypothetical protein
MTDRTLFRLAFVALLALTACNSSETVADAAAPVDMTGWRMASGKTPTKAEFAAFTATCQDQSKGGVLDSCLANLGLKRGQ